MPAEASRPCITTPHLCAVADGMGGTHAAMAWRIAVQTLEQEYPVDSPCGELEEERSRLLACLELANARIRDAAFRERALAGVGCSIAAVRFCANHVVLAHTGSVRIYRLRNQELTPLTGEHAIGRGLGVGPKVEVELSTTSIERGDVYLLCTRGIYSSLGDERLEGILRQHRAEPRVCVRELLDAAAANGGGDSLTAVVIVLGEDSGADAAGMDASPEGRLVAG